MRSSTIAIPARSRSASMRAGTTASSEIVVRDHGRWREGNGSAGGAGVGLQLMHALMDTVELETTKKGRRFGFTVRSARVRARTGR